MVVDTVLREWYACRMNNKYLSRVTSSARGELFNPLTYPFFLATLLFGIGFVVFSFVNGLTTPLFMVMESIAPWVPLVWGLSAISTIVMGATFLMFNIPPAGKLSGLLGCCVWIFAGFCWLQSSLWVLSFAVALPNGYFWLWQYLSLSLFRREDAEDKETMKAYDRGEYDDEDNPINAKADREDNRGVDVQS